MLFIEDDDNPFDDNTDAYTKWDLRNTVFKNQISKRIKESTLKYETIVTIEEFVNNYMSSNAFLSNQSASEIKGGWMNRTTHRFNTLAFTKLGHKESHLMMFASFNPTDIYNPELYVILDLIYKHTDLFTFTRTVGADRVGVRNDVVRTHSTQEIKSLEEREQEKVKELTGGVI